MPMERFRLNYGHFNEENIEKACIAGDYQILKEIIASTRVGALAKGYALVGIAKNDTNRDFYEYIKEFKSSDSPYLREACVMGLYQYLDEDCEISGIRFKELLSEIKRGSSSLPGVVKKIDTILDGLNS
jgi:hypothetical protein